LIGWLIFYFKSDLGGIAEFWSYLCAMFGFGGLPLMNGEFAYVLVRNLFLIFVLCFACTPYPKELFINVKQKISGDGKKAIFTAMFDILIVAIFALCIVYISSSEYRPNIYFEF
jgi:hypothetical protein